jgi:xanthine dehydrogenase accessory factor
VFGAGYIAKPLAAMAAGCGFDVTVVDERPEWANEERFPGARLVLEEAESFARRYEPPRDSYLVVVTHDHATDQRIVERLLAKPFRFHGMVGSIPKQRKFAQRLKARGFASERIALLRTPLGLDVGAETPEEIAVSILAELVAVRRGAKLAPGAGASRHDEPNSTTAGPGRSEPGAGNAQPEDSRT